MKAPNTVSLKILAYELEQRLQTSRRFIHHCPECDAERLQLVHLLIERHALLSCPDYNDKIKLERTSNPINQPWRQIASKNRKDVFGIVYYATHVEADHASSIFRLESNFYSSLTEVMPHVALKALKMVVSESRKTKTD